MTGIQKTLFLPPNPLPNQFASTYSLICLFISCLVPESNVASYPIGTGELSMFLSRGNPCSNMIFGSSGINVIDGIIKEKASRHPSSDHGGEKIEII